MKTLKTFALICVLSVSAFGGIIDAPCPENGCPPPPCTENCMRAESEPEPPTLQEQIILDTITGLLGILL